MTVPTGKQFAQARVAADTLAIMDLLDESAALQKRIQELEKKLTEKGATNKKKP